MSQRNWALLKSVKSLVIHLRQELWIPCLGFRSDIMLSSEKANDLQAAEVFHDFKFDHDRSKYF